MTNSQHAYWDKVASEKTFTHPVDAELLGRLLPTSARCLDFGCGYGRITAELAQLGHTNILGLDFSPAMVDRAKRESPHLDVRVDRGLAHDSELGKFDAVLLFSVLTCNPEDEALRGLIARVESLLSPGGLLYVSDLVLQTDERNVARYEASRDGPYGTFELPEGARLRHFSREFLSTLFANFGELHHVQLDVFTMNGNAAQAFQFVGRR